MLHEILLSLAGHPSALFDPAHPGQVDASFPLLSPPERALLETIAHLSTLHRTTRAAATSIASTHPSPIARAVASALITPHLEAFQHKILSVERSILAHDSSTVGAYNIVPLASLVADFDDWTRRLEWYSTLTAYIQPKNSTPCTGAALIDHLRSAAQTGYPDIETAALSLGRVAETAWLRQLSVWVLYGRLPVHAGGDFFIQPAPEGEGTEFVLAPRLLPGFVPPPVASSILFIGKSLTHIRARGLEDVPGVRSAAGRTSELDLLPTHLAHLSALALPISSAALGSVISAIRLSLSRTALQRLLPLPKITSILTVLRDFFLLGRGEFAVALVAAADERLVLRTKNMLAAPPDALRGMQIKSAELTAILHKALSTLSSTVPESDADDSTLYLARELLHLGPPPRPHPTPNLPTPAPTSFASFLLPTPTGLTLHTPSPYDLFLSSPELALYSSLASYLLSLRRAHLRLTSLWRESPLRRSHPCPPGPPTSCTPHGAALLKTQRERAARRNVALRPVWAVAGAAVFLLAELGAYFEGDVVRGAWEALGTWIGEGGDGAPRDPEALTAAHLAYLRVVVLGLLLPHAGFVRALHDLLQAVDALAAGVGRLWREDGEEVELVVR
ncbi:hypothetical protein EJ06DRAFT_545839 [Trichodelitschia bisporula]|uniref:Spindle pole body component n=1 Tax=Trichodelitschia bisporula TaxID=703511 RepID=A0A6G1IB16_9PEZI|nr:hypothetical protein EJ06DRAFT_545839 [Trichodelitschia bisporula]